MPKNSGKMVPQVKCTYSIKEGKKRSVVIFFVLSLRTTLPYFVFQLSRNQSLKSQVLRHEGLTVAVTSSYIYFIQVYLLEFLLTVDFRQTNFCFAFRFFVYMRSCVFPCFISRSILRACFAPTLAAVASCGCCYCC